VHRAAPLAVAAFAGAFDGITFAALYGMKRFLTAYTGALVRIRRDSDNAEADIGYVAATGLLDTAAAAAHIGGGSGFVVTWYDQSGNGRDATQATAGSQPAYVASGINSLPAFSVPTGSAQRLATASYAHFPSKRGSVLTMLRTTRAADYGVIWAARAIPTTNYAKAYLSVTGPAYKWFDGSHATAAANDATATNYVLSFARTGDTTVQHRRNGALADTLTVGNIQPDNEIMKIGNGEANNESIGAYYVFQAELASAISAANHNTIGNEMATLYGITWNTVS